MEEAINNKQSINELLSKSLELKQSKKFIDFFKFLSRFSHYSNYNSMLVYIQNKDVAYYGSTYFWRKKFNREVNEDARPYVILMPFGPVTLVYDIIDTIGEKTLEELFEKGIPYQFFDVKGQFNDVLSDRLFERIHDWGIPLRYKPMSFFTAGFVSTRDSGYLQICLNTKKSIEENFVVIIHELAHLFLGHTGHEFLILKNNSDKKMKLKNRPYLGRSMQELEAETIAFLIANRHGLTTQSAEYLAGYIHNENDLKNFNYETVVHIADKIERLFLK